MKTTAFLIFYAGVLITLDNRVLALEGEANSKAKGVKEEVPPPSQSFPLLTLPSFSSFSLPALNFPYLQAFSQPNRISSPERVRATKTEYLEVTRRQTVHPVCYTAYEAKAPCLPYAQSDFQEDDYDGFESDAIHQAHDSFNLNEVKSVRPTPTQEATATEELVKEGAARAGRYLEFKIRRDSNPETSSKIEGSEFFVTVNRVPPQQTAIEYHTKTVLITKLEKYTDRRVTATLLAVNCLPADRSIPMCQKYPNPIREAPDRRSDGIHFQTSNFDPTLTDSENPEINHNVESAYGNSKTKPAVDTGAFEIKKGAFEESVTGEE